MNRYTIKYFRPANMITITDQMRGDAIQMHHLNNIGDKMAAFLRQLVEDANRAGVQNGNEESKPQINATY